MKIELKVRKAVVTGSTAGIGFSIAEGLARAGASVVINGRGEERVASALEELRLRLPEAEFTGVAADLSTSEGSSTLTAKISDADILVNNLGTAHLNGFFDQSDAEWLDLFQLNVMSGMRAARHYVPGMVGRGWGRVVFISSESAVNIPKEMIDYGVTKTAQLSVSRGLAELVGGTGVTVNSVLPGLTRSEILGNWMAATALSNTGCEATKRMLSAFDRLDVIRTAVWAEKMSEFNFTDLVRLFQSLSQTSCPRAKLF